MQSIKTVITKIVGSIYLKIFNNAIGSSTKIFILNLGYLLLSTLIGGGSVFIFNVLAGRFLGPTQYGNYSLVIGIANFLIMPMLMGMTLSVVKKLSKEHDFEVISTSAITVLGFIIATITIVLLTRPFLLPLLNISNELLIWSLVFSAVLSFYNLSKAFLQGLQRLKEYSIFETLFGLMVLISFLLIYFTSHVNNFIIPTVSQVIAYFIVSIVILLRLLKRYKISFKYNHFKDLISYGFLAGMGGISGFVLGNIDRLVLNHYIGPESVGLYSAYFSTSMVVITQLITVFVTVFFPAACRANDKKTVLSKLNTLTMKTFLFVPVLNFAIISLIILFFGNQYPYNLPIVVAFSLNATFYTYYSIYSWLMASEGTDGVRWMTYGTVIAAFINFGLNVLLVPKYGILGSAIATSVVSFGLLIYFVRANHILFKGQK